MRRKLIFLFYLLSSLLFAQGDSHLKRLQKEFPFGLLTNDFGILNRDDLETNVCIAGEAPLMDPPTNYAYSYWQCFKSQNTRMMCDVGGYDPVEKSRMVMLMIRATRDGQRHEFVSRRLATFQTCQLFLRDWRRFTRGEPVVCVSGSFLSKDKENGQALWSWTFGRYKTRKGCDSYFQDECNFNKRCRN